MFGMQYNITIKVDENDIICPITHEIIDEPVLVSGKIYEKKAIEKWIIENGSDPTTRKKISTNDMIKNELITNIVKNVHNVINHNILESFKILNSFDSVKEKTYDELKKILQTLSIYVNNQKSKTNAQYIYNHIIKNIFAIANVDVIKYILGVINDDELNLFVISNCDYLILSRISNNSTDTCFAKIKKIIDFIENKLNDDIEKMYELCDIFLSNDTLKTCAICTCHENNESETATNYYNDIEDDDHNFHCDYYHHYYNDDDGNMPNENENESENENENENENHTITPMIVIKKIIFDYIYSINIFTAAHAIKKEQYKVIQLLGPDFFAKILLFLSIDCKDDEIKNEKVIKKCKSIVDYVIDNLNIDRYIDVHKMIIDKLFMLHRKNENDNNHDLDNEEKKSHKYFYKTLRCYMRQLITMNKNVDDAYFMYEYAFKKMSLSEKQDVTSYIFDILTENNKHKYMLSCYQKSYMLFEIYARNIDDINALSKEYEEPFMMQIIKNKVWDFENSIVSQNIVIMLIKMYIAKGGDIHSKDYRDATLLHYICSSEQFMENDISMYLVKYLIKNGANVHDVNSDGNNCLNMIFSHSDRTAWCDGIIKECKKEIQSGNENKCIQSKIKRCHEDIEYRLKQIGTRIELIKYLIDKGVSINHKNNDGESCASFLIEKLKYDGVHNNKYYKKLYDILLANNATIVNESNDWKLIIKCKIYTHIFALQFLFMKIYKITFTTNYKQTLHMNN